MQFLFKAKLTPIEVYSLSLLPVLSPCQAFKVRRAVPTSCDNTFQSTHTVHPCNHLFPIISPSLFAFGSSLHGCIRMSPRRNAFWLSRHLCSLALWFASEVSLCRHRICLCSSSFDMRLRQALPLPSIFFLGLNTYCQPYPR
jgi:hypothetical protein